MSIVGINASFLRKQNTGIGQVTVNFLKKLTEFPNNKDVEFILYLEEDVEIDLPDGFSKKVFLPIYKRDDLIRKIWWEKFLLPKKIKKDKCDVLLSLYQSTTVMHPNSETRHIMVVHDIIPKLFPHYLNNWRKKLYQKFVERAIYNVEKVIAVSHRTEKDLIAHLGIAPEKITVSYIDVDEIYKKEISLEDEKLILQKYKLEGGYIYSGGGLEVRKNVEGTLRAYKLLHQSYGNASWLPKLVISGKLMPGLAPLVTDAAQLIQALNLSDHVILLDYVPQEDLPVLYKNASVFVYPSLYEGFGLPVLEAMNQGTPVITSKTSSLPEVGVDSVLYCNPESVDDLAMVMKNILTNNHLKESLSLKGLERAKHFSWERFVTKIMHIIN
ncbi:MAG: Glycosyl transferase group 1 [Candidatus Moranbacteria bacterium GW2011_GWE1_36_7]|nr:MAG: Glycosyl transferase group 1 [Candidatus Moranbacteria bacterium GW2011_GWD2_36_12]KKQ04679.1 MAG: Glycosyl transferase group 1 [Candidatus Moranbacteria bacterium GW2011_GWE2_36_40]KKQ12489.1 MAG: Glycosyl transferase group 1 [Candidatus Moranbacteria bacterium GW2011_GWE1_36_7]